MLHQRKPIACILRQRLPGKIGMRSTFELLLQVTFGDERGLAGGRPTLERASQQPVRGGMTAKDPAFHGIELANEFAPRTTLNRRKRNRLRRPPHRSSGLM